MANVDFIDGANIVKFYPSNGEANTLIGKGLDQRPMTWWKMVQFHPTPHDSIL